MTKVVPIGAGVTLIQLFTYKVSIISRLDIYDEISPANPLDDKFLNTQSYLFHVNVLEG